MQITPTASWLRARWAEQFDERPPCPRGCTGGRTWHDGERARKATLRVDGESAFMPDVAQRRKRCSVCKHGWTHRPEAITSRAHFQPCVVSHAIGEVGSAPNATTVSVSAEVGCAPSTVRRWAARVATIAEPSLLASALVEEVGEPVLPKIPTALAAPQRSPRLRALLLRAVTVLVLLEALASVRGYAPPALGHAAHFIPAITPSPRIRGDPSLSA